MEHLTKQQIVLLTLLVSFMTSISTGIVTVSLMDQAPASVTRTINQVIEKTIQQASPQNASVGTVSINVDDQLAAVTSAIASSTVKIQNSNTNAVVGLGLIISKKGLIITDKSIIDQNQSYSVVMIDGTVVPVSIGTLYSNNVQTDGQNDSQYNNSVVFLSPTLNFPGTAPIIFNPIQVSSKYSLGQKIFSLAGTSDLVLGDGLINEISSSSIGTSINSQNKAIGSPLFDIQGNVIGIQGVPSSDQANGVFYSLAPLIPSSTVL